MSPYDDLLLWASEKRHGSLSGLRAACAWAADRAGDGRRGRDVLDDLLALGHVDVRDGRWEVVPAALAVLPDAGGNACFVGARPRWLLEALGDLDEAATWKHRGRPYAVDPAGAEKLSVLADEIYDYGLIEQRGPGSWILKTGPEAPLDALTALGVRVLGNAADGALQRAISQGASPQVRTVRPGELAGRLAIEGTLLTASIAWEPASTDATPGVYRYMRNNQAVFAERTAGQWLEIDYRWAVWRAAHRSACVWYEPRTRRLYLPTAVRPPLALERALVLRTGRLPTSQAAPKAGGVTTDVVAYENMTNAIATQVAALLGKETKLV